jgi:hypothetical protein
MSKLEELRPNASVQGIFPNCLQTFYKLSLDGSLRGEVMPWRRGAALSSLF